MSDDRTLPPELDPRGPRRKAGPGSDSSGASRGGITTVRTVPSWRRPLGIVAATLAVCVLAASGVAYGLYLHYDHNLHRLAGVIRHGGAKASGGAENVLLVGSDSRSAPGDTFAQAPSGQEQVAGQRSDTVILAHLAAGHHNATLVSLPRDSWVTIPAYTDAKGVAHPAHLDKLNAAFSLGGAPLLVSTVQLLTGIHVDHYAEIDFAGFQNMVNSLGGVDVCLARSAHDVQTGLNLSAGQHHLNGVTALAFVRQRYGLPLGDIDRIRRQQQFLASMTRKVESTGTLVNPAKLNAFLDALTKSITVDSGMGLSDMTKLALKLKGVGSGSVALITMPLAGFGKENGQDVDLVDQAKASALFQSLMHDSTGTASASASPSTSASAPAPLLAASAVRVRVFNGAGIGGLARRASSDLANVGFAVVGTPADRGRGATASVIEYGPTEAAAARTLAAAVPGSILQANQALGTDLELIVGSSYNGAVTPGTSAVTPSAGGGGAASGTAGAAGTGSITTAASAGCTD